jgi:hypothetical protein
MIIEQYDEALGMLYDLIHVPPSETTKGGTVQLLDWAATQPKEVQESFLALLGTAGTSVAKAGLEFAIDTLRAAGIDPVKATADAMTALEAKDAAMVSMKAEPVEEVTP